MFQRDLQSYHHAWLAAHPHRTAEWLKERLYDGFDVHHLDGNHDNDLAENLVLIDCVDHLMLHGSGRRINRLVRAAATPRKRQPRPKCLDPRNNKPRDVSGWTYTPWWQDVGNGQPSS